MREPNTKPPLNFLEAAALLNVPSNAFASLDRSVRNPEIKKGREDMTHPTIELLTYEQVARMLCVEPHGEGYR